MRLAAVERGHRLAQRLKLLLIRVVSMRRVPDVVKTLFYRPEFFAADVRLDPGGDARALALERGERELFAAFTSRLNQCVF